MVAWRVWGGLLLLVGTLACGDDGTEPAEDPFPGRWLLLTVNGQPLPASGSVITPRAGESVLRGVLHLPERGEGHQWDYCLADAEGNRIELGRDDFTYLPPEDGTDQAELFFPGNLRDTLTLASGQLTWEYNLRSAPGSATDLLRFRRLQEGEGIEPVCDLDP